MISAACKSCSGCSSSSNSTCSSSPSSTSSSTRSLLGSSTSSSNCSSSSDGQANSSPWRYVNRFRFSPAQSGIGALTSFHEKIHQLVWKEVHGDHRIVDPMLQTPPEKTCACTNRFGASRRYPASHEEISESTNQMHIPQQHAHLHKTIVFEPTSCTNLTMYFSRSDTMKPEQGGKSTAWSGRTSSRFVSADLRPEVLLESRSREVQLSAEEMS